MVDGGASQRPGRRSFVIKGTVSARAHFRSLPLICLTPRTVNADLHGRDGKLTCVGAVSKGASFVSQIVNSGKLGGDGKCKFGISLAELQSAACKDGGAAVPSGKGKGKVGKGGKGGKAPKGFSCPPKGDGAAAPESKPAPKAVETAPKEAAPSPKTAPKEAAPSPKAVPKEAAPSPKAAPKEAASSPKAAPKEAAPTPKSTPKATAPPVEAEPAEPEGEIVPADGDAGPVEGDAGPVEGDAGPVEGDAE